jgi:uncharacterized protein
MERVVVFGASNKEDRYSYKACSLLLEYGHKIVPVHPTLETILDNKVYPDIKDVPGEVDTLTLYVNPKISEKVIDDIIKMNPKRVIMNPGTESDILEAKLKAQNIKVIRGCTLVMLKTSQY